MSLFSRIKPQKTFHITIEAVAKFLGIPPEMIVRIEKWANVLFVHRRDIGGQFVSYRRFQNWSNAVASKIKNCYQQQKLLSLWASVTLDLKKYAKQYDEIYRTFVNKIFHQQWSKIISRNNDSVGSSMLTEDNLKCI